MKYLEDIFLYRLQFSDMSCRLIWVVVWYELSLDMSCRRTVSSMSRLNQGLCNDKTGRKCSTSICWLVSVASLAESAGTIFLLLSSYLIKAIFTEQQNFPGKFVGLQYTLTLHVNLSSLM